MRFLKIPILADRNPPGVSSELNVESYGMACLDLDRVSLVQSYAPLPKLWIVKLEGNPAATFLVDEKTAQTVFSRLVMDDAL